MPRRRRRFSHGVHAGRDELAALDMGVTAGVAGFLVAAGAEVAVGGHIPILPFFARAPQERTVSIFASGENRAFSAMCWQAASAATGKDSWPVQDLNLVWEPRKAGFSYEIARSRTQLPHWLLLWFPSGSSEGWVFGVLEEHLSHHFEVPSHHIAWVSVAVSASCCGDRAQDILGFWVRDCGFLAIGFWM